METLIDGVLSVDFVDIYKPAPQVYALAANSLRLPPDRIGFVSSNCWDAIGARAFGFTDVLGQPYRGTARSPRSAAEHVLASLAELPDWPPLISDCRNE